MPHTTHIRKTKAATRTRPTPTKAPTTAKGESAASARSGTARKPARTGVGPRSIVNYTTAQRWLYDHADHERMRIVPYNNRTFSLERVRKLLSTLDNPHHQIKCVQVAGTKGKGSTCAMLASMLQACGYTVGLYTSPHLIDLVERIAINGEAISRGDLADLLKLIANKEHVLGNNRATFFEIMTAAALRHFAEQAVDVAVLETGLGGRLDATTVVTPLVTGMAHISLEHTNILGHELTTIAREKAGIFKKDVAAVSVEQESAVRETLQQAAENAGTTLEFTGREIDFSYRFEASRDLGPHTRVCVTSATSRWDHLAVPLKGEHQAHNCGLALAIMDKLKAHGFDMPEDQLISGLAKTNLPARMEHIWKDPRVLTDGAHNASSITALIRSLGAHISYDSLVLIFGCGQDKDIDGMLKEISLGADKIIFTRARANPRAHEPEELMTRFAEVSGKMAQAAPNLEAALQLAARAVSREDLIVITGSFYLAGEAKKYFLNKSKSTRRKHN